MMRFMSLSSGSCGNCYYLGTGDKGLLIDAGVNFKRLKKILEDNSLSIDSFGGILVTHDHLDHIRHLGQFCRKLYKPVYTTSVLRAALLRHTFTAGSFGACSKVLEEVLGDWTNPCLAQPEEPLARSQIGSEDMLIVLETRVAELVIL